MLDNITLLKDFFQDGTIDLKESPILYENPTALPVNFDFDKIEGMLLGIAIGDSLGNTTENQDPYWRNSFNNEIKDYLPNPYAGLQPLGCPSDDTQLTFWTLERIVKDGGVVPDHIAQSFSQSSIFGATSTLNTFLINYKDKKLPWYKSNIRVPDNTSLKRITPVILPYIKNPSPALYADTIINAIITNNDSASTASCFAFIKIIWQLLSMDTAPNSPGWWIDNYCNYVEQLEGEKEYKHSKLSYKGSLYAFVKENLNKALDEDMEVLEACKFWGSSSLLIETIPSILYILIKHADDPEKAIIRAVNDTFSNDTIGSIVGGVVGAIHGKKKFPKKWISGLSGKLSESDKNHIFDIIKKAEEKFFA